MTAASAITHHAMTAGQALGGTAALSPMDSSTPSASGTSGSSSDSSDSSATITANDFLTLLVTEMQNQDPTADTDPNEYINQLVQVNSLEQLININQTLSTDLGGSTSTSSTGAGTQAVGAAADPSAANSIAAPQAASHKSTQAYGSASPVSLGAAPHSALAVNAPGNLSQSSANASAQRVAHSLDGRTRAKSPSGGSPATE
jgi:flagellar basal-body rod modification protein FlgD